MWRALPAVLLALAATPAAASCTAANQYNFAFANQSGAIAYGDTKTYSAASTANGSRSFTMAITANGLASTTVSGVTLPTIATLITGTDNTKADLIFGGIFQARTPAIGGSTNVITVTFTFATAIRDFAATFHDVDFTSNQYRDWLQVTGNNAAYTPVLGTPWGQSNATGGARTSASSSVVLGATATPVTLTTAQAAGNGDSNPNSNTGTVSASFAQPVTSVTIKYGNYPLQAGETATGQQAIGLAGISFCPMPQVSVTKVSAPVAGAYGAYNLPGSDIVYSLTVTNAGGSPVDDGAIVLTDPLPGKITFRNAAFDGTTTLPFKLTANGSGVTLPASAISYSNNGGATWTYTPSAGYDANVTAIRLAPVGTMAANSAFTIAFDGQVK